MTLMEEEGGGGCSNYVATYNLTQICLKHNTMFFMTHDEHVYN